MKLLAVLLLMNCAGRALPAEPGWLVCVIGTDGPSIDGAQIEPGQQARFGVAKTMLRVGTHLAFPLDRPLPGLNWRIEPEGQGVTISQQGVVTAAPNARSGTYRVLATAAGQTKSKDLEIFRREDKPLVGVWREVAQLACGTGGEVVPPTRIAELVFDAAGGFSVTWHPFETYRDYTGTYQYQEADGKLTLSLGKLANYKPADLQPVGRARIDARGRLVLDHGLWLGKPRQATPADADRRPCGHIFAALK